MSRGIRARDGAGQSWNKVVLRPKAPRKRTEWQRKPWKSKNGPVRIIKKGNK